MINLQNIVIALFVAANVVFVACMGGCAASRPSAAPTAYKANPYLATEDMPGCDSEGAVAVESTHRGDTCCTLDGVLLCTKSTSAAGFKSDPY